MKRCGMPAVLLVCVVLGAVWVLVGNQQSAGQSPDEWRQLSLPDFVREITQLTSAAEPLSDALWTEIRSQSAERLLQAIAAGTGADYGNLVSLYVWARPVLTPEQITTVLAGLVPPANQVSAWTYEQMRGVHGRMNEAGLPVDSIHALTLAWLENRDVRTITNVDQLGWLFAQVQLAHRQEIGRQEFTVRWSGSIQGPADGVYTLSICPLALNFRSGQTFRDQTTKIFVADQPILDSTENGWTYAAHGVTLAASQRTPLRIELSFACSSRGVVDALPAVALLYWEAPGMAKQLVPSAVLATPDGSQPGLQGEYVLPTRPEPGERDPRGRAAELHLVPPVLRGLATGRRAIAIGGPVVCRGQRREHAGALGSRTRHEPRALAGPLGAARIARRDTSQKLGAVARAHPALLEDCANWAAASVYSRCRFGAPTRPCRWSVCGPSCTAMSRRCWPWIFTWPTGASIANCLGKWCRSIRRIWTASTRTI